MDAFSTSAIDNNGIESEIDIVKEEIPLSEAANKIAIDNLARKMQNKERKLEEEKARRISLKMNQQRKHQCVMSKVNEINIVTELCTADSPATISYEKMCLHYVIHYIKGEHGIKSFQRLRSRRNLG